MKKEIISFILSLSAITIFSCSCTYAQDEKVPVILDTDFNYDVDDVGAVAMFHALADKGEARILVIGISDAQEKAILALDAMNTWYNRPELPIGVVKSEDAPCVIDVYRRVLAEEPDIDKKTLVW